MSRDKLIDKGRQIHQWRLDRRTNDSLADLAETINPIVRGWINYWSHFYGSAMIPLLRRINTQGPGVFRECPYDHGMR